MSILHRKPLIGLALCALLALGLWPAFHSPAMPMDEGMVLVYPEMFLKGHLPYRDFESITGPGNPLILATAYATFGTNIFVERAVGLIYRLLIVLAVFGVAQRWGALVATSCAFITTVLLGGTDLWANTWYAGVAFALCSLWTIASATSRWRCVFGGLFAGFAVLARCDFGPALVFALLPLFLAMNRAGKLRFSIGGLLGLTPLIWITAIVGPSLIWHSLFIFPVFHLNPGRHLPIADAKPEMIYLLALQIVASVTNITAAVLELRSPTRRDRGRLLWGAALLGLAFIHYALQRFDSGHALNAAFVALSFLPLSVFLIFSQLAKAASTRLSAATAVFISLVVIHLLLPSYTRYLYRNLRVIAGFSPARQPSRNGEELEPGDKAIFIEHNGRPFPFGFPYAADDADKLLTELERVSLPGQRLFVGPGDLRLTNYCDTYIYYIEPQLIPATYFLEMNPASANAPNSRLSQDIASADWVILNRRWDFLNESNRSIQFGSSDPIQAVKQNFDFWWEQGSYLLFRNKKLYNVITAPAPMPPKS